MEEPHAPEVAPIEGKYGNHFQVGYNAFEVLVDFGQAHAEGGKPRIHTRIIMSPVYARVLAEMLFESLRQYEQKYGEIPKVTEQ